MKRRVYRIIHKDERFIKFIYSLIIFNVVCLILQSYKELQLRYDTFFELVEILSVSIFTVEYLLRLWTSDLNPRFSGGSIKKRLQFIVSPFGLIDLIAIVPFYLPLLITVDLRILRILRLFRLLRIFKLGRYSRSLRLISSVIKDSKSDLSITIFVAFILLVLSSTLMYYVEGDAQPEKFGSIGDSFWWAVATLTTVGYGDVYPITGIGKILSAIIALIGIGFVALPTGIISSAFIDRVNKKETQPSTCTCPNCGHEFEGEQV